MAITSVSMVCPPYPEELLEKSRQLLMATIELTLPMGLSRELSRRIATSYPEHTSQARRLTEFLGGDAEQLLAANLCYDLLPNTHTMGCSTMALSTPGGPLLARNMDWVPADLIARASCLVEESFGVNAGFIGMVGAVTALSRNGFALCLNAVVGGSDAGGYPVLLFLRHVLDTASGFDDAVNLVTSERLMSGAIITVVGQLNRQRVVIERTPRSAAIRTPQGDEPLTATNHYRQLSRPEFCPRHDYLAEYAGKQSPLEILTHPQVLQSITAQHILMHPATGYVDMYVPTNLL